jgi:hypothetical protein
VERGWGSTIRKTPDTALYSTYVSTVLCGCQRFIWEVGSGWRGDGGDKEQNTSTTRLCMCLNGVGAKINISLIFGRLNSLFVVHQVIFKRLAQRCKSTPVGLDLLEVILSWPCKYSSLPVTLGPYYHAVGCGQYGYSAWLTLADI